MATGWRLETVRRIDSEPMCATDALGVLTMCMCHSRLELAAEFGITDPWNRADSRSAESAECHETVTNTVEHCVDRCW